MNKILNLVLKILAIIALVIVVIVSLATAYIVFAPDTLPKPFYLQYNYPTSVPTAGTPAPAVTTTPTPLPPIDVKPGQGVMINSGTKIINLADPTGKRYLRVTIVLEFAPTDPTYLKMTDDQKAAYTTTFNTALTPKMPLIDDSIITLVSTKDFQTLYTADGKEKLRGEIKDRVNQRLPDYKVVSVYFTEFVVD